MAAAPEPTPPPNASWRSRFLHALASCVYRYPRHFLFPQIALLAGCVLYTIFFLDFSTDRNELVGADKKYHQIFLQFVEEFGAQDDLVAIVESNDPEKNRQFVERLGTRLEQETELFTDVFYKGDLNMLGTKALFFLDQEDLTELRRTLQDYRPFLESFAQTTNLNSLFRQVNREFRAANQPNAQDAQNAGDMVRALPALTRIVEQATASLVRPGIPPAPGINALFNGGAEAEAQQYITFDQGRIYLVNSRATSQEAAPAAVNRLRELVRQTQLEVPGINAGITGETVLELDEMRQSQIDSTKATIIALTLVALLFIVAYREIASPLKATLTLIVGLGFTMGYTTLVVGHLNILTVTFLPILVGLAIDFGVHFITRYEEEMRGGGSPRLGLEKATVNTGMGIFTGCLTTAGAFFAMGLTDFKGVQEMGIITGGGMLICLIPMMTLLPILLMRGKPRVQDGSFARRAERRAKIERLWLERPWLVMGVTAALLLFSVSQIPKVYFDYNLLNMQSKNLDAVLYEKKLIHSAHKSVLFAAVVADDLEQAVQLERELLKLPTVQSIDSMAQFLAADHSRKLEEIERIQAEAEAIEFAPVDPSPVDPAELSQTLFFTQSYLGLAVKELAEAGEPELLDEILALRRAISEFRNLKSNRAAETLGLFQRMLFRDIHETFETLRAQDTSGSLQVEDLPTVFRNRFIGRSGKHLLQVYPKENIWEREQQERFIQELRTVHENVTGTPVQLYEYTTVLRESYERAAWYALAAISLLVFLHFRSVTNLVLALLPVAIGATWLGGMMGWLGIPFNPANIMILPLVIGIGVTNGIHILNRFAEEQNPGILAKSTGKAVLVSGLTTIAGFGSLLQAEHEGIASLGLVMVIGVASCMVAALTFLPALLNLLIRGGWAFKKPSGDNALSSLGREEPR